MRKNTFFILFLSLIITLCSQSIAYSDEDFWDEPMQIDESAKTQEKTVTDSDFEKVMSFFEKKKKEDQEVKVDNRTHHKRKYWCKQRRPVAAV